jgi:wobble nucleotide-excising tRNase
MVAKGDDNKPAQVPKLILENEEDIKRFIEAMRVREIKEKIREEMDDAKSTVEVVNAKEVLKNERCVIKL